MRPDPAGYAMAWSNAHGLGARFLLWGGDSHNSAGNNSVRLGDPVADTWDLAWPNTQGVTGSKNRDNHASFYVGNADEFWTLPGQGGYDVGRFSLTARQWTVYPNWNPSAGTHDFSAYCEGFGAWTQVENPACGWCAELGMGLVFGGATAGTAGRTLRVFSRQSGAKPYRYAANVAPVGAPAARDQLQGSGVMVGRDFYVIGGRVGSVTPSRELWKCTLPSLTWTRLADSPAWSNGTAVWQANTPFVHDAVADALVGLGPTWVLVYWRATNRWERRPIPAGQYGRATAVGAFCPTIGSSLFTGGTSLWQNGVVVNDPTFVLRRGFTSIALGAPLVPLPTFGPITVAVA